MLRLILNRFAYITCNIACAIFILVPIITVNNAPGHFFSYLFVSGICLLSFFFTYRLSTGFEKELKRFHKISKHKKKIKTITNNYHQQISA